MVALIIGCIIIAFALSFTVSFEIIKQYNNKCLTNVVGITLLVSLFFILGYIYIYHENNLTKAFYVSYIAFFILILVVILITAILFILKHRVKKRYFLDWVVTTLFPIVLITYIIETDYLGVLNGSTELDPTEYVSIFGLMLPTILLSSFVTLAFFIISSYVINMNKNDVYPEAKHKSRYLDNSNLLAIMIGAIIGIIVLADVDYTIFRESIQIRYIYMLDIFKFVFSATLIPLILDKIKYREKTSYNEITIKKD